MLQKACIALLSAVTLVSSASAQFNPSVSLIGSRTFTRNYSDVTTGIFDVSNRTANFGFELTNKFALDEEHFIKTGIRYHQYETNIGGVNRLPLQSSRWRPLQWERRFEGITIPVSIGKNYTAAGRKGDVYAGISGGVLMTSYSKVSVSSDAGVAGSNTDITSASITDHQNQTPSYFLATADVGASFQPFKTAPRFSVGTMVSVHLTKTEPYTYQGTVKNESRNLQYDYSMKHSHQSLNASVLLTYTFGKLHPATKEKE